MASFRPSEREHLLAAEATAAERKVGGTDQRRAVWFTECQAKVDCSELDNTTPKGTNSVRPRDRCYGVRTGLLINWVIPAM